jgi:hypothetical protein
MSFNKRIIPSLDKLIEMREEINNDHNFLEKVYGKGDCFMGPKESFEYLEEIKNQLNK